MRLVSRSVVREIWPPFLLGFAAYTFVLLIRTILFLADFAVRRSAPFLEVARLVALSLPWIVVLTLPMAFLLGVLIGLGRMSADSEIIALRACGVGPAALYRPALGAAAALSVFVFGIYNAVLPATNAELERAMARVAATSIVNLVSPRTFREPRPGITFFFDRIAPDGRSFEGIFLKLGEEAEAPNRIIVARRGGLTLEGDRLWLDLYGSTVHEIDPEDPSRYRTSQNAAQRLLLAGLAASPTGSSAVSSRGVRARSLPELWSLAHGTNAPAADRRLAWVEIHKKLAIPFACFAFAFAGVPLAQSLRRGGRGSAFALSLVILLVYYILLTSGETWAEQGRLPPALAMWLPNLFLLLFGIAAAMIPSGRRPLALPRPLAEPAAADARVHARKPGVPGRLSFQLVSLLDRYVVARFLGALALVLASSVLLGIVVDYADKLDEVARNHPPAAVVVGYYRYFLLSLTLQILPFAVLLATLSGLGTLSKNNEDTAFKASGVPLFRLAAPVVLLACALAALCFSVGEYVLPFAERNAQRYKNVIYGWPEDAGVKAPGERNWYLSEKGEIWHREDANPSASELYGLSVFSFGPRFELLRRTAAHRAIWEGNHWQLRHGWTREFDPSEAVPYRSFADEAMVGDPPRALAAGRRRPEEMRFRELQRLASRLRASGYATASLETALQAKLAQPALIPVMALLAAPFAFRVGRRGTLAGIGVGLLLGIAALIATAFLTKLGDVGALPPMLAAWSPNILFGLAATYFVLRLRS